MRRNKLQLFTPEEFQLQSPFVPALYSTIHSTSTMLGTTVHPRPLRGQSPESIFNGVHVAALNKIDYSLMINDADVRRALTVFHFRLARVGTGSQSLPIETNPYHRPAQTPFKFRAHLVGRGGVRHASPGRRQRTRWNIKMELPMRTTGEDRLNKSFWKTYHGRAIWRPSAALIGGNHKPLESQTALEEPKECSSWAGAAYGSETPLFLTYVIDFVQGRMYLMAPVSGGNKWEKIL